MLTELASCFSEHAFRNPHLRVLAENWIICAALVAATCLLRWYYKGYMLNYSDDKSRGTSTHSPPSHTQHNSHTYSLRNILARIQRRQAIDFDSTPSSTPRASPSMRFARRVRATKKSASAETTTIELAPLPKSKQLFDAFLVLDVEATCHQGTDFDFPNEIIEFPVCLMKWKDRTDDNRASKLEVVAEFRSFVRPTWRPLLSDFCTALTGITQEQVDAAPIFSEVLDSFQEFLVKHGLIDKETGERLLRFCWCSDGPFDVRDFVVKQCFISKIRMPLWLQGDILDIRTVVMGWLYYQAVAEKATTGAKVWTGPKRRSLNIAAQLGALGLPAFEGRQHSGIDDSRNLARVITELAKRGVSLQPNTVVHPNRRWQWMGKHGQILDDLYRPI